MLVKVPQLKPGEVYEKTLDDGTKIKLTGLGQGSFPKAKALPPKPPECIHCGNKSDGVFPPPNGLGDNLGDLFASVGITKEKYVELKAKWTKEEKPKCGCNWRQKAANWIGNKIGLPEGKGPELQRLVQIENIPDQDVYDCSVHGQCLKYLNLKPEDRSIVESAGYHLCQNCEQYEPRVNP